MANPVNPLDVFVTVIPHYELHLSNNWPELAALIGVDLNAQTDPDSANGTLLINTRKDAHQQIDNIKFMYYGPMVDPSGALAAVGDLSLEVIEPNGVSFVEKLMKRMAELEITNITDAAQFGLKIFFVGRLADGSEQTIPFNNIIPLHLINLEARYSHKGGEYNMRFVISSDAVNSTPLRQDNGVARNIGFVNKNISFKANSVKEALELLEDQLNKNYSDVYATELLNSNGAKSIKYKIELDPKICGSLNLVTKDSLAPGEKCQLTFSPTIDIGSMIRQVIMSSKDVCGMIAESRNGISKEGHPGVKLPVLQTFYNVDRGVVNVIYRVNLYEGSSDEVFEFDYYFSGKNVDVLEFEVKFNQMNTWMSASLASTEYNRSATGKMPTTDPSFWAKNIVPTNKTCEILYNVPIDRKAILALRGDIATLPGVNRSEGTGLAKHDPDAVPIARLAFETIGITNGATNNQVTFTIRGHLDILNRVVYAPDGSGPAPSGVEKPTWIKVNIFDKDGNPFFYTGKYHLLSVENIFQGGKFIQNLTVIMMDPT